MMTLITSGILVKMSITLNSTISDITVLANPKKNAAYTFVKL